MGNTVRVRHIHLRLGPILLAVLVIGAAAWFTADRQARQERDPAEIITQANVDIASLDFIFYNPAANTATITQEAFRACEADVEAECRRQRDIYELAEQNAENVLRALVSPILEQLDGDYVLTVG